MMFSYVPCVEMLRCGCLATQEGYDILWFHVRYVCMLVLCYSRGRDTCIWM
jgi:hypothetical protein